MNNEELCNNVIDMAESALQASKMNFISDDIHKLGLTATLQDIINLVKEESNK